MKLLRWLVAWVRGNAGLHGRSLTRCRACRSLTWRDDPYCLHCGVPWR